jgi:hypothetical protein
MVWPTGIVVRSRLVFGVRERRHGCVLRIENQSIFVVNACTCIRVKPLVGLSRCARTRDRPVSMAGAPTCVSIVAARTSALIATCGFSVAFVRPNCCSVASVWHTDDASIRVPCANSSSSSSRHETTADSGQHQLPR